MAKFLFLETIHGRWTELSYASCVAKIYAQKIRAMGHEVIEISDPTPQEANAAIAAHKPDVVWWVGHGNTTTTTLKNIQVWIKAPNFNTGILDKTIACALSCETAAYLGEYVCTQRKCKAYLGYFKDFYFLWCGDPVLYNCACSGKNPWHVRPTLWKKMVMCMHDANLMFVYILAAGGTAYEAYISSINRSKYWIEYFNKVKPENTMENYLISVTKWILNHNMKATKLCGDKNARVPRFFKMSVGLPLLIFAIGALFTAIAGRIKR